MERIRRTHCSTGNRRGKDGKGARDSAVENPFPGADSEQFNKFVNRQIGIANNRPEQWLFNGASRMNGHDSTRHGLGTDEDQMTPFLPILDEARDASAPESLSGKLTTAVLASVRREREREYRLFPERKVPPRESSLRALPGFPDTERLPL